MPQPVPLAPHPATPAGPVREVVVEVARPAPGVLTLAFVLEGALGRMRVPPPAPPRMAHDLWQHTCFEVFVSLDGGAAYHEVNLAPSGAWGAFAFRAYRDGGPLGDPTLAPAIAVRTGPERLRLTARIALDRLSPVYPGGALRIGLAAVVEDASGAFSYWALRHPAGAPDFHHRAGFVLRLEPPGGAC